MSEYFENSTQSGITEISAEKILENILKPSGNDIPTVVAIKQAKELIGEAQLMEYFQINKPKYFGKPSSDQIKLEGWAFESFARNIVKLKEAGYTEESLLQTALDNILEGLKPNLN